MAKHQNKKPQPKAKRDDFSSSVKKTMAERVAYLCSNPDCRIQTVGPHSKSDKVNRLGEAAHITAAIEGGERYDPNLTVEERKAITNGIWLCCDCHKLVDSDPDAYPVELLRRWKAEAEAEAKANLGKPAERKADPQRFPLKAPAILLEEFVPGSRDTELAALRTSLEQEHTVYLWGFGGMGKSETAIRLAHDLAPADKIFLMHYQNSMRETILKLNFEGYKLYATEATNTPETYAEADLRQRMKMLKDGYRDAILIVDNFDVEGKTIDELRSEPACRELLSGGFRLIFTTRSPLPRPEWEIKPLTPEYQLKLMRNLSQGIRATDEELIELIEAVDGHTLTLALMAKTLKASLRVTPKLMLDAIRGSTLGYLNSRAVASNKDRDMTQRRIEAHLATLFDLSSLDEDARTVLACATLLPDGGIEPGLFLDCLPPEQQEALEKLTDINWLTLKEGLITIHPVMRQVCRMSLKPDEQVCGVFLEELWKQYDNKRYDAPRFKQMGDCFALATDTLNSLNPWYSNHAGRLYSYVGLNDLGLAYFQKAVDLVEKHDPDNGEMLGTVWNDVAYSYSQLGNNSRALELDQSALDIRKKVLPENHPDLALSYGNVATDYSHLGDHQTALELAQTALDIRKRVLPEDHPQLALSYDIVGGEYSFLGDHKKALEFHQFALDIRKRVLPEDHPDLARSYDNVGTEYSFLGDHKKALELAQSALDIRKRVLPEDHPDLAVSYNNVGTEYSYLGDHKKALELVQSALDIRKRVLPEDHPDMAHSYGNVGNEYSFLGDHKKALEFHQFALDIRKRVLPEDHPDMARSYGYVGIEYSWRGDHKKALEFNHFALDIRKRVLPEDHPDMAHSYGNVGNEYGFLRDHNKALEFHQFALDIRKRVLPEDHPDLARSYGYVGSQYSFLGDHNKALEFQQLALDIRKRVLPETHPDLGRSHREVGICFWNLNRTKEVLPHLLKAMEIWEQAYPPGHPYLTEIYNTLADYHMLVKSRAKAAHFRRMAQENRAKTPK